VRILADENVPRAVVERLRIAHDVAWVLAEAPGSGDPAVLERAQSEERVLLTFDKDFGELAFRAGLPATSGVILVRAAIHSPDDIAELVAFALKQPRDWQGHFSVLEDDRIRMTPLPPGG
jgi:predicted nuclease of predicted toxin-antitoxin system